MQSISYDYKYSLDLVNRINRVTYKETPVSEAFVFQGINFWYFYQASIFAETKEFSKTKILPKQHPLSIGGFTVSVVLFLFSFVSLIIFLVFRRKILVFCVDAVSSSFRSDFRMKDVHNFLKKFNYPYWEMFHTVPNKKSISNMIRRFRPVWYLESIDFLHFLTTKITNLFNPAMEVQNANFELRSIASFEEEFVFYILNKYVGAVALSRFRISTLSLLLRYSGIKLILTIDDTRTYNELLVAARKTDISSWAFQHGHFTKYHIGWLNQGWRGKAATPDKLFVWSDYWKKELLHLNSNFLPHNIFISGREGNPKPTPPKKQYITNILIPYETDAPKKTIRNFIISALKCRDTNVIFKIRPDKDEAEQIEEYGLKGEKIQIVSDIKSVIDRVSAVGGVYSTFLYDMVMLEKPVFIIESEMDYGAGMIENGIADLASSKKTCEEIRKLADIPIEVLEKRRKILLGEEKKGFSDTMRVFFEELFHDKKN